MTQLEQAIELALKAHAGQLDKAGRPYILHPLHLMMQMETETERITAVLHDVIEDSHYSLNDLAEMGFSDEVLQAVGLLTHAEDESYEEYIAAIKGNPLACKVKLADLHHNMDMRRMVSLHEKDFARYQKYHLAWQVLSESI